MVFAYKSAADIDSLLNGATLQVSNQDALGTETTLTGVTVGQVLDLYSRTKHVTAHLGASHPVSRSFMNVAHVCDAQLSFEFIMRWC